MCLVFVAWRAHPRYRLVVAANRDEYHARPTAPAAPWEAERRESGPGEGPRPGRSPEPGAGSVEGASAAWAGEASGGAPGEAAHARPADADAGAGAGGGSILAGRDLAAGGTWLGVTADGRFAALTNYRGSVPPGPDAPSRGRLVADFLRSGLGARGYARETARQADRYSGFHLLLADRDALLCVTNRGRGGERVMEAAPGCHGLANDHLNDPCPRVGGGLPGFRRLLLRPEPDPGDLFALLADDEPAAGAEAPASGLERVRSARFIRSPEYGTRSSTVVRIAGNGAIAFEERSFDARARETARAAFERSATAPAEAGFAAARTSARPPDRISARNSFRGATAD